MTRLLLVCVAALAATMFTALLFVLQSEALAYRDPPKEVTPVIYDGVEYRTPLEPGRMGWVEAWDTRTGKMLWEHQVYSVFIAPFSEEDVQWVFIKHLAVEDGKLSVVDERNRRYRLDLLTGEADGPKWIYGLGWRGGLPQVGVWAAGGVIVLGALFLLLIIRRRARRHN